MAEEKRLKARVAHKHKTEAEWYKDVYDDDGVLREDAFVPLNGELIIFDPDESYSTKRFKFGDGVTNVIDLPFTGGAGLNTEGAGENAVQQENAKALAHDSAAFGANTIAGGRTFAIDVEKERGATTTTILRGMSGEAGTYFVTCADSVLEELNILVTDWANETDKNLKTVKEVYYAIDYTETEYEEDGSIVQQEDIYSNVYPDCGYITGVDIENKTISINNKFNLSWDPSNINRFETEAYILIPAHPTIGDLEYGYYSFVTNESNTAMGHYSMANGRSNRALDNAAHAEGHTTTALKYAHSEGTRTNALGRSSHTEGRYSTAYAFGSHAEGYNTKAIAPYSHAEGKESIAGNPDKINDYTYRSSKTPITAHAEGDNTTAASAGSHTEGNRTLTGYKYFEVLDKDTAKVNIDSVSVTCPRLTLNNVTGLREGYAVSVKLGDTVILSKILQVGTSRIILHQDNYLDFKNATVSTGEMIVLDDPSLGDKHAESAPYAHAEGEHTIAASGVQHVYGSYNIADLDKKYIEIAGNGTKEARSNAYTLDWHGNAWFAGDISVGKDKIGLMTTSSRINELETSIIEEALGGLVKRGEAPNSIVLDGCEAPLMYLEEYRSKGEFTYSKYSENNGNTLIWFKEVHGFGSEFLKTAGYKALIEGVYYDIIGGSSDKKRIIINCPYESFKSNDKKPTEGDLISIVEYIKKVSEEPKMALGKNTIARGENSLALGRYNLEDLNNEFSLIMGNGTNNDNRSNAVTFDWNGNAWFAGDVTIGVEKAKLVSSTDVKSIRVLYLGAGEEPDATTLEDGVLTIVIGGE